MGFNPLPLPKQGEIRPGSSTIHRSIQFQSAPLTEARGDLMGDVDVAANVVFQSAPLTEARGDLAVCTSSSKSS